MNLTPLEQLIYNALDGAGFVSEKVLAELRIPEPPRLSNHVMVHIKNMRKKGVKIETLRGEGYRLKK